MNLLDRILKKRTQQGWIPGFDTTSSLFIHIPKTAGTSISIALYGKDPWHYPLKKYRLSKRKYGQLFKFAFVRNPYDRLYSSYLYSFKEFKNNPSTSVAFVTKFPSFESFVTEWLTEENVRSHYFFYPQIDYILDKKQAIGIDYIGKFETLDEDFRFISRKLEVDTTLPKLNTTKHEHFSKYYTEELSTKVHNVYKEDFELFGYQKIL